ncbi:head-tail adaptor protein [Sphingosinithalassobacter portus]|uniref:head-tail adaptor protein n=1 Tax=Stakelama portus TaxID=2676234 RepID=UPI000D6EA5C7|nr:head-tail adaptor protein [Sphingosinithalassobacter portus]
MIAAGALRHLIRVQQPVADASFDGAGSGAWHTVAEVRANVTDLLPSRGEKLADGLNIATRPARVRIRYRAGLRANMRVLIGHYVAAEGGGVPEWITDRTAQIITVPAELGWREGLEFMIEDYSTAGNPA